MRCVGVGRRKSQVFSGQVLETRRRETMKSFAFLLIYRITTDSLNLSASITCSLSLCPLTAYPDRGELLERGSYVKPPSVEILLVKSSVGSLSDPIVVPLGLEPPWTPGSPECPLNPDPGPPLMTKVIVGFFMFPRILKMLS